MDKLKSLFKRVLPSPSEHRIVVVQYERDIYTAPEDVEQLHWAIIVIVDEWQQQGPCWQVTDRHYRDGSVEWTMPIIREVNLGKTSKCLGGVSIGLVKAEDIDRLEQTIVANKPVIKFEGWNCRDWVMEVIDLLRANGWVTADVTSQAVLYPALRTAGAATKERREKGERKVEVVDVQE